MSRRFDIIESNDEELTALYRMDLSEYEVKVLITRVAECMQKKDLALLLKLRGLLK